MLRKIGRASARLAAAVTLLALASTSASAISISAGDIIVVFQKGGTELIVNIGNATGLNPGALPALPAAFGGSLTGAKVAALGVRDFNRTVDFGFGPLPQPNIMFSQSGSPLPSDSEIEAAMNQVDLGAGSTSWFQLLRTAPGTSTSATALVTDGFSFEFKLGDFVGNTLGFAVTGIVDGAGNLTLGLFEAIRGYAGFGGPATQVTRLGTLTVAGNAIAFVPEPVTLLLLVAGLGGLAVIGRKRV